MRTRTYLLSACALVLAACQRPSDAANFNPTDPVELAAIDSVMQTTIEGARTADADLVLKAAEGPAEFTFITGDVMLSDVNVLREKFRASYAHVKRQDQEILDRRVRLITPNVALYTFVGEGTYTTDAGFTSEPVGMGVTIVLVKHDGKWQAQHAHQSIAF